ncbi:hypothetical protein ABBQ32_002595 [Trebouxia sp. C0010 RCD-2024]
MDVRLAKSSSRPSSSLKPISLSWSGRGAWGTALWLVWPPGKLSSSSFLMTATLASGALCKWFNPGHQVLREPRRAHRPGIRVHMRRTIVPSRCIRDLY